MPELCTALNFHFDFKVSNTLPGQAGGIHHECFCLHFGVLSNPSGKQPLRHGGGGVAVGL